jgi:glutaredoxin
MQCSNCGKQIPFEGKVCPYCHADKSTDQREFGLNALFWWCIFLGCLFGFGVNSSFIGLFIGGLVGAIAGAAIYLYFERKRGSG